MVHSGMPELSARVRALHARMTLEEKLAQLVGFWVDQGGEVVAPMADEMATSGKYEEATKHGIGHLTRVYGTRPVDAGERAAWLAGEQKRLQTQTRLGIPALVHEECLTGLAAWKAATFPTPLAWGAAFDEQLVEEMGHRIGESMRALGIHQGLAPVLDVVRDPRWGRVDECISEDPYVVGMLGTAYVRGLQAEGIHATLKHFVGYSASQSGRNHAPVHAGPREIADVLLPPFEMAVRDGGVRSVMNSYAEIDGVPVASDPALFEDLLRGQWGFDGVVVSDYFAVAFLHLMHGIAGGKGQAAELALTAGIDVELPTGDAYLEPLAERIRTGVTDDSIVDRAVLRVLAQKEELGLLDDDFSFTPEPVDLDSPAHRDVARRLAEGSIVLLTNDGTLPLAQTEGRRVALIGPNADSSEALMGCYSFANHVLAHHPGVPIGFEILTVADAITDELTGADITLVHGSDVTGTDSSAIDEAVAAALDSDVAIIVAGDRAGLFGRGTVGEGNDTESLELPGVQRELVERVVATGTPVVLVLLTGRPYAIDWAITGPSRPVAVVQAFFPGEEGGAAIAGVLSGRVNPSGRLPVSLPRSAGAQPYSYLHPTLGGTTDITSAASDPVLPFGHGLSYASFEHTALAVDDMVVSTDATFSARVTVRNTGERRGADVVQLYAHDEHASVTRPVAQLVGYARVELDAGETAEVSFQVPPTRLAFSDRALRKVVEPGRIQLWVGSSCAERETETSIELTGEIYETTGEDARVVRTEVTSVVAV
ncbi:glycoside hydrolase family 3 N-terminal domain-containing protein [Paramicrobacterium fandaimingii]|uniref:beta-xylosidase/alpha-l-arabinosidase n=1 Tax=Paramicrobacterium fandaimingii TaxID=2708079 RepID=UPI0014231200|nr:glycoside hydrolase family 3 N-terminal domain-containing protein [Microbacterium fandaimingii]